MLIMLLLDVLHCSLVNNRVGIPMDIVDSFTIGQTNFGANINYAPSVKLNGSS